MKSSRTTATTTGGVHAAPLTEPCVQIPIIADNIKHEWQMLELQGNLSSRPEKNKPLDNLPLGHLKMNNNNNNNGKCELIIGRQKCDGKQVPLKRPLVVLEKVHVQPSSSSTTTTTATTDENASDSGQFVHYKIVGVVRDRLHFANRPVPLSPSTKNQLTTTNPMSNSAAIGGIGDENVVPTTTATTTATTKGNELKKKQATKNLSVHPMFLPRKPSSSKK